MAVRILRTDNDEILRKTCRDVTDFNPRLGALIDDMVETMAREDGVGLAAPQVGVLKRVFVIHEEDKEPVAFINPVILSSEGEQENAEACLSLPNRQGMVTRPFKVTIKAQNRLGQEFTAEADDILAVVVCHELDHLDGILYTDKVTRMLTREEIEALDNDERPGRARTGRRKRRRQNR